MNTMTQPKLFNRGSKLWIRFSMNGENIRKPLNLEPAFPPTHNELGISMPRLS